MTETESIKPLPQTAVTPDGSLPGTCAARARRLFLFAAYTPSGKAGPSLEDYLRTLSGLGDVVFCDDSALEEGEIRRIGRYVLHAEAVRHREYDFGSYRRDWEWAKANPGGLEGYDFVYLVNDSVYGPLRELSPLLERLESQDSGAFCLVWFPHRERGHMQSWFLGFGRRVFTAEWFDGFMESVTAESGKGDVCAKYETGLTRLVLSRGIVPAYAFAAPGKSIYNSPLKYVRKGLPFVKKSAFTRHGGSLGRQIGQIVREFPSPAADAMVAEAAQSLGDGYMDGFINQSRLEAARRYILYLYGKLRKKR